ncbi:Hypothetical predicted protein [Octopus vulgaris]|uniref:Uncharacterized protein n=1 Tax=Octopus vulgaris TaxID=6645 RepID=A0AA36ANA1_OCTVU|nr:Hypothetical predicted protein [Octopus vulgaris]
MRWCGRIVRMVDERMLKQLFYGELAEGKRYRCKPKEGFKDGIRTTMKSLGMVPEDIETLASDRVGWRTKSTRNISTGQHIFYWLTFDIFNRFTCDIFNMSAFDINNWPAFNFFNRSRFDISNISTWDI